MVLGTLVLGASGVAKEAMPELPPATWLEESGIAIADFDEWLNHTRKKYTLAGDEMRLA